MNDDDLPLNKPLKFYNVIMVVRFIFKEDRKLYPQLLLNEALCKECKIKFNPNKTHVEVIKEGAIGGVCLRDIYSGVTGTWCRKSWKEFNKFEVVDQKFYCSDYYNVSVNKYGVKYGTSLRFWENKDWINEIDPYGWFQWYLKYWVGKRSEGDERQVNR